ncbi:hypothetical protein [Actinoplanes siamensis]|uniref:Clumping factor A n=1 Tax=Actinoplanes siamensis TaxID=1223317 RepID=A0A919TKX8_9ACTN|nr:hypothetical protein [Actinoplanes siamensis]GIF05768.1 hypothetical protein Asi03nite_33060 [Actinoplanes siamensis]
MIPASLPLILVGVVCLAIGLIRGSSSLLIASIVANLLAAVALVIGVRQNSAARRRDAADQRDPLGDPDPLAGPDRFDRRDSFGDPGSFDDRDSFDDRNAFDRDSVGEPPPRRTTGAPSAAHDSAPAGNASAADSRSSATAGRTDPNGSPAADQVYEERPVPDQGRAEDLGRAPGGAPAAGTHLPDETVVTPGAGAARDDDPDDQLWRRPVEERAGSAGSSAHPAGPADPVAHPAGSADPAARPAGSAAPADHAAGRDDLAESPGQRAAGPWASGAPSSAGAAAGGSSSGEAPAGSSTSGSSAAGFPAAGSSTSGSSTAAASAAGASFAGASSSGGEGRGPGFPGTEPDASLGDGFGEPDADDPDDEPLPQSVRPTDAVQVARLDTEVLVVDGRPRYHMADCPHLVGRLTEPLPAAEAVELGFSPCGLCRPVDRLLGANARR